METTFKKGDIIADKRTSLLAVFEKYGESYEYNPIYYSTLYSKSSNNLIYVNVSQIGIGYNCDCRLATEEEKSILIHALKNEANNGNEDTKNELNKIFNLNIKTYDDLIKNQKIIDGYYNVGELTPP